MRRFLLLLSIAPLVACGARTTALSESDFAPPGDASIGADTTLDSTIPDVSFDSRLPPPDSIARDGIVPKDSAPPIDSGFDGGGPTDHTTGDPCKSDDDCDKTGAGESRCAAGLFSEGTLYPNPVCVGLDCDPGDGTRVSHCDGDKGICLDAGGTGICLGICSFDTSGAPAKGCAARDACNYFATDHSAPGALVGYGYCFGGCFADADCTGGERCQKESGLCVRRLTTYTKKIGDACTLSDVSSSSPACNCLYLPPTNKGYCSAFCEIGVATSTCPTGYTCDALLPKVDPSTGGPGFSGKVLGLAGYCTKDCATDAECAPLNGYCEENGGTGRKTCQPGARP
jgi:hypothetical protein